MELQPSACSRQRKKRTQRRRDAKAFLCDFASLREGFCFFDQKFALGRLLPFVVCSFLFSSPMPAAGQMILSAIEKTVGSQIPVPNLTWQELQAKLASVDSAQYVLFDTRSKEEYEVSHLPKAVQVDPQMPVEQFFRQYEDSLKNKNAVFYCSVGYRSSRFVQRVQKDLQKSGARIAFNLQGGIFRWYTENNAVFNAQGQTEEVHPYDEFWGGLLKERKKVK